MSGKIILVDFDGTLECQSSNDRTKIQYNEELIHAVKAAQQDDDLVFGFTSWSSGNYAPTGGANYQNSPGRRRIVDEIEQNYDFTFDAVVTSSTYLYTLLLLRELAKDKGSIQHYLETLDDDVRITLLGEFFYQNIYEPENGYEDNKTAESAQTLMENLQEKEAFLLEGLEIAKELGLPEKPMSGNKDVMFAIVELVMGRKPDVVFDDKHEVIVEGQNRDIGTCTVTIAKADSSQDTPTVINSVDYSLYIEDAKSAKQMQLIIDAAEALNNDALNIACQNFLNGSDPTRLKAFNTMVQLLTSLAEEHQDSPYQLNNVNTATSALKVFCPEMIDLYYWIRDASSKQYSKPMSKVFGGIAKDVKLSAADKFYNLVLGSDEVSELTHQEMHALRQGSLGTLVASCEKLEDKVWTDEIAPSLTKDLEAYIDKREGNEKRFTSKFGRFFGTPRDVKLSAAKKLLDDDPDLTPAESKAIRKGDLGSIYKNL